ncbi:SULTR2, partial [Symbiodinium sp. KB8]
MTNNEEDIDQIADYVGESLGFLIGAVPVVGGVAAPLARLGGKKATKLAYDYYFADTGGEEDRGYASPGKGGPAATSGGHTPRRSPTRSQKMFPSGWQVYVCDGHHSHPRLYEGVVEEPLPRENKYRVWVTNHRKEGVDEEWTVVRDNVVHRKMYQVNEEVWWIHRDRRYNGWVERVDKRPHLRYCVRYKTRGGQMDFVDLEPDALRLRRVSGKYRGAERPDILRCLVKMLERRRLDQCDALYSRSRAGTFPFQAFLLIPLLLEKLLPFVFLNQVIPGSELTAIVANDMLSNKLLAFHLDYHKAAQKELRRALLRSHQAYGGGVETWRFFTSKLFADSVLDGGTATRETWLRRLLQLKGRVDFGGWVVDCKAKLCAPCTIGLPPAKEKPGFEELLRKQAARRTQEKVGSRQAEHEERCSARCQSCTDTGQERSHQKPEKGAFEQKHSRQGPQEEGDAASCSVTSETDSAGLEIIKVVVHLPGLSSAAEASLEVSPTELKVASLRQNKKWCCSLTCLTVLPTEVETSSSTAKWRKYVQVQPEMKEGELGHGNMQHCA